MAEVRWSLTAASDLETIEDWIAQDSPLYAVAFIDRLVSAAEKLRQFPEAGRIVPEFARQDLREVIYRSYRVVYLLQAGEVTVLRVVHGARDLEDLVNREPWNLE